jgi:hypothetical protein
LNQIDFLTRWKEKLLKDKEYQNKWDEEERLKRASQPNPYSDEIEKCLYLVAYCNGLKKDYETKKNKKVTAEVNRTEEIKKREDLEKEAAAGKIEIYTKKEDEATTFGSKGKKKDKKKKVVEVVIEEVKDPEAVNLTIQMMNEFASLKVKVPSKIQDLEEIANSL